MSSEVWEHLMSCKGSSLQIAFTFLFGIVLFSAALCYGQTLEEKLALQTNFIPLSDTPVDQLIEIAQKFKISMTIEWVEQEEESDNQPPDFSGDSVLDLIAAVIQQSPDCIVTKEGEILHVFSQSEVFNPLNFLNLQIPEYSAFHEPLFEAERLLRMKINRLLYPGPYGGGYGGGGVPNSFRARAITLVGYNLTIREILNRIAEDHGNALWIVKLNPDELTAERPTWEGVPRNKSGHSPLNCRWQFIPLDKEPQ
jgi:hypothetical protein